MRFARFPTACWRPPAHRSASSKRWRKALLGPSLASWQVSAAAPKTLSSSELRRPRTCSRVASSFATRVAATCAAASMHGACLLAPTPLLLLATIILWSWSASPPRQQRHPPTRLLETRSLPFPHPRSGVVGFQRLLLGKWKQLGGDQLVFMGVAKPHR